MSLFTTSVSDIPTLMSRPFPRRSLFGSASCYASRVARHTRQRPSYRRAVPGTGPAESRLRVTRLHVALARIRPARPPSPTQPFNSIAASSTSRPSEGSRLYTMGPDGLNSREIHVAIFVVPVLVSSERWCRPWASGSTTPRIRAWHTRRSSRSENASRSSWCT